MHRILCSGLAALVALPLAAGEPPPFRLEEVRPGLTGWGLSVFDGSEPQRFEVEVLGVWRNVRPDTSYILARLSGRGLEETGVVAGMSGSPVYFDDRLAGAVAFSWIFAREAIAGITPIGSMRRLLESAPAAPAPAAAGPAPRLADLVRPPAGHGRLIEALRALAPAPAREATSGLLWTASGFAGASRALLAEGLGPLSQAGVAAEATSELAPGAPVAGVLIGGDLHLGATGTVTDRLGDRVLAFGHTFLGLGPVRVPMAGAEVVTVVPSQLNSFKVTNLGPVVGAFDFDHLVGLRGRLGEQAPTLPVTVAAGDGDRRFELWLADVPQITPILVALSLLGALDADPDSPGDGGLDLEAAFDLGGDGELRIRQSFDGPGAGIGAAIHLLSYSQYLMQNPLSRVELRGLEIEVDRHATPRTARLVAAHANRTLVRPGEPVEIHVDLATYRGGVVRRSLQLELPTGLPEGPYYVLVGDGTSIDAARLLVQPVEPVNLRQALTLLRSFHSRREVVALGVYGGPGLAVAGEVLPGLPDSVRSLWSAAASGSAVPLQLTLAQEELIELDVPVEGIVRIDLQVERREPLTAADDGEGAGREGPEPASGDEAPAEATAEAAGAPGAGAPE